MPNACVPMFNMQYGVIHQLSAGYIYIFYWCVWMQNHRAGISFGYFKCQFQRSLKLLAFSGRFSWMEDRDSKNQTVAKCWTVDCVLCIVYCVKVLHTSNNEESDVKFSVHSFIYIPPSCSYIDTMCLRPHSSNTDQQRIITVLSLTRFHLFIRPPHRWTLQTDTINWSLLATKVALTGKDQRESNSPAFGPSYKVF